MKKNKISDAASADNIFVHSSSKFHCVYLDVSMYVFDLVRQRPLIKSFISCCVRKCGLLLRFWLSSVFDISGPSVLKVDVSNGT